MKAKYHKYILNFKQPSVTSRGVIRAKETYFIVLSEDGKEGVGECGLFRGLSIDDRHNYEDKLKWVCASIFLGLERLLLELKEFPSIQFGLEQAFLSLKGNDKFSLFPSKFTEGKEGLNINGLIWMGDKEFMKTQIEEKIKEGFSCIKMKIGGINFEEELSLIKYIRKEFSAKDIELRVDANGAFQSNKALEKLKRLSEFDLHSIEQPIKQGQLRAMSMLCEFTPLPIALDEELIGVFSVKEKQELLEIIKPQYIILKPSLIGGIKGSNEWIQLSKERNIGWWITSALESNVGLNAIAQYTYSLESNLPQGLGTGGLFTNNFESPLEVENGRLQYNTTKNWEFNLK